MRSLSPNLKPFLAIGAAVLVIVGLLVFYGDRESPKQISLNRLQEIEQAIVQFIENNKRPPADLSELGLPAKMLQDHLGEPFKYQLHEQSITVLSYGSDKEPGGSFFKRDFSVTIDRP